LVRDRKTGHYRRGRAIRFSAAHIEAYLQSIEQKPTPTVDRSQRVPSMPRGTGTSLTPEMLVMLAREITKPQKPGAEEEGQAVGHHTGLRGSSTKGLLQRRLAEVQAHTFTPDRQRLTFADLATRWLESKVRLRTTGSRTVNKCLGVIGYAVKHTWLCATSLSAPRRCPRRRGNLE